MQAQASARYRQWSETVQLPLFHQPRWLDAVAPGAWQVALLEEEDEILAAWPFVLTKKLGLVTLANPALSHRLGPWLAPSLSPKQAHHALVQLVAKLPRYDRLETACAYDLRLLSAPAPLCASTAPSYQLDELEGLAADDLLARYPAKTRTAVRRGEQLEIRQRTDAGVFAQLVNESLKRQGAALLAPELIGRVLALADTVVDGSTLGEAWQANTEDGKPAAVALFMADSQRVYYLLSGRSDNPRAAGAVNALLHRGIQLAARRGLIFDFEGSRIESLAAFFASFGAQQVLYPVLSHVRHPLFRLLAYARR